MRGRRRVISWTTSYVRSIAGGPPGADTRIMTTYRSRLGVFGIALFAMLGVLVFRADLILDVIARLR